MSIAHASSFGSVAIRTASLADALTLLASGIGSSGKSLRAAVGRPASAAKAQLFDPCLGGTFGTEGGIGLASGTAIPFGIGLPAATLGPVPGMGLDTFVLVEHAFELQCRHPPPMPNGRNIPWALVSKKT